MTLLEIEAISYHRPSQFGAPALGPTTSTLERSCSNVSS